MFDFDGLAPKIRALYDALQDWTQTTANLLLSRVDATISSAVSAANAATTAINTAKEKPPAASGLFGRPTANADLVNFQSLLADAEIEEQTAALTTFDTWVDLVNYTGSGVVEFVAVYQIDNASSRDAQVELLVDGVSAYLSDADLFKTATTDDDQGVSLVGLVLYGGGRYGIAFGRVRFATSVQLRAKKTEDAAGTVNVGARVLLQKWS